PDASHTGLRAHRRLPRFDAREAEDAFLGFARRPVVVDLLVRTSRHAHPPAAAFLLVDQDDPVLGALVDRPRGTRGEAGRVQAVFAQPRQVHQERLLELAVDLLLDPGEIVVAGPLRDLAAEVVLPVAAPFDLLQDLAGYEGSRLGRRLCLDLRRLLQPLVLERVRLVEVVDLGEVGVGEDLRQDPPFRALARLDPAVLLPDPAALPAVLVLPVLGIADPRLGLDVVEPDVFDALAVGPDV